MNKTATEVVLELVAHGMRKEAASARELIKFMNKPRFRGFWRTYPTLREGSLFGDSLTYLTNANEKLKLARMDFPTDRSDIKLLQKIRRGHFHDTLKDPDLDNAIKRYE